MAQDDLFCYPVLVRRVETAGASPPPLAGGTESEPPDPAPKLRN